MRLVLLLLLISGSCIAQVSKTQPSSVNRPKLVVGVVVDQMRWDYLYRYYNRYAADGGFRRLLDKGFSCENTHINYMPTYTACGHATLYTGTVPAVHGITGNEWWDVKLKREIYCVEDDSVKGVGTTAKAGQMSPRNMFTTSVCDELKLATNFRSKVIGIAFKDRGGILPAGHAADGVYWYEPASGKFISSSWYGNSLPQWVTEMNNKKLPDQYFKKGWNTIYPIDTYQQSTKDEQVFEGKPFGKDQKGFPYKLDGYIGKDYNMLTFTPHGNTLTREMATAAVTHEQLGKDSITDFLAISFSTPDYIGHSFGPNSIEAEDNYLQLDRELGQLFSFLDNKVGKGEYLVFLSADHAAAHVPVFMKQNKLPAGTTGGYVEKIDSLLSAQYGKYKLIESEYNSQLFYNHQLMDSLKLNKKEISRKIINYLMNDDIMYAAFEYDDVANATLTEKLKRSAVNGYFSKRSGDIQYILKPGYFLGGETGTTHGSPFAYDTHIPLLWYGWNIKQGKTSREVHMTDVAPTISALLHIQMPNGNIGEPIREIVP